MIPRRLLISLVALALAVPPGTLLLFGVGKLLGAMQDAAGEAVLVRISQAMGIAWLVVLLLLVLALGIESAFKTPRDSE